ncbi:hypothetical protein Taro_056593, partial [Colocasia esculenta]|nr:hypothetical protein [Colocasia esculenta]
LGFGFGFGFDFDFDFDFGFGFGFDFGFVFAFDMNLGFELDITYHGGLLPTFCGLLAIDMAYLDGFLAMDLGFGFGIAYLYGLLAMDLRFEFCWLWFRLPFGLLVMVLVLVEVVGQEFTFWSIVQFQVLPIERRKRHITFVVDESVCTSLVKSRVGSELKQNLLLFCLSWRPRGGRRLLASRFMDVDFLNLAAVVVDVYAGAHSHSLSPQLAAPESLKLPTGTEEWLDDRGTRGVAELREETSRRGAIRVGARGGLGVNREFAGDSNAF